MLMTPHQYMQLYRNLKVAIVDDQNKLTGWQAVDVNKYLLTVLEPNADRSEHYNIQDAKKNVEVLQGKVNDFFAKPGAQLKVYLSGAELEERTFTSRRDVWYYASKAFWGKACPQEMQITLQLALRFGLAATPTDLQAWCDKPIDGLAQGRIGLDCNGFVGNYLDHGFWGKPWDSDQIGTTTYTANTGINDYMARLGPEVKSLDDIRFTEIYVMGLVGKDSPWLVINGGPGNATGHTVISTPFTFIGAYKNVPRIRMQVCEATPNAGIAESEYYLLSGEKNVFEVYRGSVQSNMRVRIRPVR